MHPLADTGRVIAGRYLLQAPVGRGAMGVVWRARDQLLDRDVAVKEVHIAETLTDAERANAYQRTLREAKTAARLNHPAVVTVYDVCEDGGRPWIVMQLVSAQSLDQVIAASGPLSPRRAAEMARQLLSALSVAHAAGVMHRDVKPSNVLLGNDDRAVLTDFGIATFQGDPKLTQTGMVMGSPGFTAPERIRGEDASPASDLWSLGATLFAAVEGHGPFEKRGGAITTMSAIINEDAPEAPTAGALGPVIAALLRREPADRPDASAAARMITDVLPSLADRPPAGPAGYEATALSASSRPALPRPLPVPPRLPQPSQTSLDFASAEQTAAKPMPAGPAPGTDPLAGGPASGTDPLAGGPASGTDPLAGGLASDPQTAPTAPQPVQGYPSPGSSSGQGARAGHAAGASAGSAARPEGPPPDFSSWYDPSPRSGAAAAPPGSGWAWSGSAASAQPGSGAADQPPPGHGSASWSGSASQQPPGPVPWSGADYEPPSRRRSGAGWKIAIAALAIIGAGAGAATVVLLHKNHSGSPQGGTSAPATGRTLAPANLITAINQPLTGAPAPGYRSYQKTASGQEKAGFGIAAPTTWTTSTNGAFETYLTDPAASNVNMLVDLTPHTYSNMLQEAQYVERQSIAKFPGYHRVNLEPLTIRGTAGSFWKFTWTENGVQQTALDLLFVLNTASGPQSYALYATAPSSKWQQLQPVFDEELRTFAPLSK